MAKENNLREELLKQMESSPRETSNVNPKLAQEIIAKDTARVRRLKRITVFSWLLVIVSFVVVGISASTEGIEKVWWMPGAVYGVQALLLIAVIFTISLYVRSRTLNLRQIQATLSDIQEQLKKMSQAK
jgi:membrane protein YdbS with pleckstrin-like domain